MASGRRRTALIFCTSPVRELYLEPTEHYDPDVIFVFRGTKTTPLSKIEDELFETAEIKCNNVENIRMDTTDYLGMVGMLDDIVEDLIKNHPEFDIFINISSGTHEFAAAAVFASMMHRDEITPFNVEISGLGMNDIKIKEMLIKLSPKTFEPEMIKVDDNIDPSDEVLEFLKILKEMTKNGEKYLSHKEIIEKLRERGAWTHNPNKKSSNKLTSIEQLEEMYLGRHYFDNAIKNEWLKPSRKKIEFTEKGLVKLSRYERPVCLRGSQELCKDDIMAFEDDALDKVSLSKMNYVSDASERNLKREKSNRLLDMPHRKENVIQFERGGKEYRYRITRE